MRLLDWLRDGLLGERSRIRHLDAPARRAAEHEAADPSGPHHFGRRAHRPDPNAHYGFGDAEGRPRR